MSAQRVLHDVKPQLATAGPTDPQRAGPQQADHQKAGGWRALEGKPFDQQVADLKPGDGKRPIEGGNGGGAKASGGGGGPTQLIGATLHNYGMARGDGQATVVSAVAGYHTARDSASMSDRFLDAKKNDPSLDDDAAWALAAAYDANAGGDVGRMTNPKAKPAAKTGRKIAWVVGNGDYAKWPDLPGATADAAGMAAHYRGEGYQVIESPNLTGAALNDGARTASAGLVRGDDFVLYFAGHGAKCGVVGVDSPSGDAMPVNHCLGYPALATLAADAVGKGYGARIILDACHTGGLQDEISKNHASSQVDVPLHVDSEQVAKSQTKYNAADYKKAVELGEHERKANYDRQF